MQLITHLINALLLFSASTYADSPAHYSYNTDGQLTSAQYAVGKLDYAYDPSGNLQEQTNDSNENQTPLNTSRTRGYTGILFFILVIIPASIIWIQKFPQRFQKSELHPGEKILLIQTPSQKRVLMGYFLVSTPFFLCALATLTLPRTSAVSYFIFGLLLAVIYHGVRYKRQVLIVTNQRFLIVHTKLGGGYIQNIPLEEITSIDSKNHRLVVATKKSGTFDRPHIENPQEIVNIICKLTSESSRPQAL